MEERELKQARRRARVWGICLATLVFLAARAVSADEERNGSRNPPVNSFVSNVTFVVFDTETTGFSPTTDRIV